MIMGLAVCAGDVLDGLHGHQTTKDETLSTVTLAAQTFCLSMIFFEIRFPLFGIML
jgi:hypothetical protein